MLSCYRCAGDRDVLIPVKWQPYDHYGDRRLDPTDRLFCLECLGYSDQSGASAFVSSVVSIG